jgi:acyl-CoA synthetase (AMP-forming)/AMP-acid ligase II
MSVLNVAAHLPKLAAERPHALAVVNPAGRDAWDRVSYTHYTFRQLDQASDYFARRLDKVGIVRGTRTVLMVPPSLEFFALTFALFKLAAVPVVVDPGMGVRNLGKCLKEAQPGAFVGIPKAHLARRILGWGRGTVRVTVSVGRPGLGSALTLASLPREILTGGELPHLPVAEVTADEMAAVLFTSGSTGVAKGVVYTHGIFSSQVEAIRAAFAIQPGEIDLATFPLFALFGPALGMTAIVPDMNSTRPARVDPEKIFEAVTNFGVTNLFGSPALLNRVARTNSGERGCVSTPRTGRVNDDVPSSLTGPILGALTRPRSPGLPSLRRVISAGAPVPASVIDRFVRLLPPGTQVFTPYGATEALPVAVIGSDEILGETRHATDEGRGVCVGRPVAGITVKVIRISDEAIPAWSDDFELPPGEVGEIAVSGPWVTPAYFNRPEATKLAKIAVPGGGFFHRMGDVGHLDDRGRLWFCGRKSQRVVTKTATLFTDMVEPIFNTHPAVFRSALVGVRGEPVLCVEREPGQSISDEQLRKELLAIGAKHEQTGGIRTVLFHPAFPVDIRHNAKIFRERLAAWAAKRVR